MDSNILFKMFYNMYKGKQDSYFDVMPFFAYPFTYIVHINAVPTK